MNDNEIIKALEHCSDGSGTGLIQATLDLINRQKAEIEKLTKLNDILLEAGQRWQKCYETLVKEFTEGEKK
jgi:hypothetical protein